MNDAYEAKRLSGTGHWGVAYRGQKTKDGRDVFVGMSDGEKRVFMFYTTEEVATDLAKSLSLARRVREDEEKREQFRGLTE